MYTALRYCLRAGLRLYFGRIHVAPAQAIGAAGPVVLACNHPNGFLDALVVAAHVPQRLYFMARGDAFRHPLAAYLLRALYMIPISRMGEGRAELRRTKRSFAQAQVCLKRGRSILVFADGVSEHGAGLRPLGKGAARIAGQAWSRAAPAVAVVPVWLWYGRYDAPFSPVQLRSGAPLSAADFPPMPEAVFRRRFNGDLSERMRQLAAQAGEVAASEAKAASYKHPLIRTVLAVPALLGFVLHAPWYHAVRAIAAWRTKGTAFFGSVLFALLFLSYPLWLVLLLVAGSAAGIGAWAFGILLVAPLSLAAMRRYHLG